jgi:lipoprotein NlpD
MKSPLAVWSVSIVAALLASCQAPAPAPVQERPQPPSEKILVHRVSEGESLYVIAWRYELDYSRLARVNGLSPPYTLYPGQKLSLDLNRAPPPAAITRPSQPVRAVAVPDKPDVAAETPPKVVIPKQPPLPTGKWAWHWPAEGRVVKEYDAGKKLKGISIYTVQGEKVKAAAPGVVVYAGNGLRGYGNLVIVKHSDKHLSAYAHNKSLLVRENDTVSQGQSIALVGSDTSRRDRLYFEIRENGKPVNPLGLLPRK